MRSLAKIKILFVLSLSLLGLIPCAENAAQQQVEQTVRIGAWNIEWLGLPSNRHGEGHDVAQTPKNIADYIMASEVDILGLEEVNDNDGDMKTRTNSTITEALDVIKEKTGKTWKHLLF
jgi:hypothetical protein